MKTVLIYSVAGIALLFGGCAERDKKGNILDNPTSGHIHIAVDESLRPLLEAELDTFEALYTYASIDPIYVSEGEAIEALIADSVRLAVVTRKLTPEETAAFTKLTLIPTQVKVAYDAVAIILNRNNPDSTLTFSQLREMMEGKIQNWKQINPKSPLTDLNVVFDNPQSGIVRFLKDSVANVSALPKNFYAVSNNKAVADYVAKNEGAMGWIGVSWISDRDDSAATAFLNTIRVARISKDGHAVQPYQAYIADGEYPLRREAYIISREPRMGLGSGFTSFVAGDKGQRIVLKSGMVPATMPVRLVNIHRN